MNRARLYINIKLLLLAVLTLNLSGCELDERVDDLTGGYEGAFIDRLTGEKVATDRSLSWIPFMVIFVVLRKWT